MTYYPFDTFTQVNNILSVQKIAIKLGKHKHKIPKKLQKTTSKGKSSQKKRETNLHIRGIFMKMGKALKAI